MTFKRLSRNAIFVIVKLYEKFNGYNRFDLSLTYSEIKDKLSNTPFADAIFEAFAFGFIDIRRAGRLERNCTIYGLSDRWRRLEKNPERLDEIESLLDQLKIVKREKGSYEKRTRIRKLKAEILNVSVRK